MMTYKWRKGITPGELVCYRQVGAQVSEIKGGMQVVFDEISLKRFYLEDVLMHEIGHHVDKHNHSTRSEKENFAKWFATEYGYRLRNQE